MARRNDWQNDPWSDAPAHVRERLQDRGRVARRRMIATTATLALMAAGFALFAEYGSGLRLPSLVLPGGDRAGITAPVAEPTPPPPPAAPASSEPPLHAGARPQSLENCLADGEKTLDNRVARCRFGAPVRSAPADAQPAQGMVSAEYLARYRAEKADRPTRTLNVHIEHFQGRIHRDHQSFFAEWEVLNNRIDYGSVCQNYRKGSIDYRECRKTAKHWYRVQCRQWDKQWDIDREDYSRTMQERYCSAANGFSPMG